MRKTLLVAALIAPIVLGALLVLSAPSIVRWYVLRAYPFVSIEGEVIPGWRGILFRNVRVTRPGLMASFEEVQVDFHKNVRIHGGSVNLDIDAQKDGGSGGGTAPKIQADGLTAEIKKGDVRAKLDAVKIDSTQVCFDHARVTRKSLAFDAFQGCIQRDKSTAKAERIEVPVKIPFSLPQIASEHTVVILNATAVIQDHLLRFDSAKLGPFELVGPAVARLADDTLYLDAPRINVDHPWVAPYSAYFKQLSITALVAVLRGEKGKFRVRVGQVTVFLDLKDYTIDGEARCGEWLDILPHPLPDVFQDMEGYYTGDLSFEVRVKPTPYLKIKHDCKYACSEEPIKTLRKGLFTYSAYDKDGNLFDRQTGFNSKGWIAIADLPPHIPQAFITLEDPGFYYHKGIHVQALENSLKADLATGRFVRGGSTISMQLAKNLWLRRHKTVGRKAYEALLTVALESCLSKAEILELYVNVVEYGPNLYGIGPATKHYFDKPAQQLELDEAFYLASLLPHPKKAVPPKAGGMDRVHKLMRALAHSGFISEYLVPEDGPLDTEGWSEP